MAQVTLPKPPTMLAAKALSAIEEPIPTVTNSTGPTSMPASPPSMALYMKVIMIISITGIPRRLAISLSWEVACIFLPRRVCSKERVLQHHHRDGDEEDHDILAVEKHFPD